MTDAAKYRRDLRKWAKRRQKIVEMKEKGLSNIEIAGAFRISRERVRQLLAKESK